MCGPYTYIRVKFMKTKKSVLALLIMYIMTKAFISPEYHSWA